MFSQVPLLLPEVEGRSEEQELVEAEGRQRLLVFVRTAEPVSD
jgi:hypothetical protein